MKFFMDELKNFKLYWNSPEKSIHRSLTFLIIISQVFGYFPVQCLVTTDVQRLKFSWFSIKVIFSLAGSILAFLISVAHIRYMIVKEVYNQFDMNGVIFYLCGCVSTILFIIMAKNWPFLMKEWNRLEIHMEPSYGWPKNLDKRFRIMSACFLIVEAVEHLTIQSHKLKVSYDCKGSVIEGFKHFSVNLSFPQVFDIVDYSPWLGILLQLINSKMAFSWTFIDLFIMILGTALAARLKQITKKIKLMLGLNIDDEWDWRKVREDYVKVCRLCNLVNKKISYIILLSFATNFYFIIFQLFEELSVIETTLETIYFVISFGLLVLRLFCVCLYGSWILEETKTIRNVLLTAQHKQYNLEVDRFLHTIRYEIVCFSGNNYFRITKGLILKIASAVVTYELIVIQFSGKALMEKKISRNSLC